MAKADNADRRDVDFSDERSGSQQPGHGEQGREDDPHQNLRQTYGADAQNFSRQQFLGGHGRQQHLQNAGTLLFNDRAHHRHAVDEDDGVQQHHHGKCSEEDGGAVGTFFALLDAHGIEGNGSEQRFHFGARHALLGQAPRVTAVRMALRSSLDWPKSAASLVL